MRAPLALACLGLALFDVGQMFSRPSLSAIAGQLDITLVVAQGLACLAVALACWIARRSSKARADGAERAGNVGAQGGFRGTSDAGRTGSSRRAGVIALAGTCVGLCVLGEAAIIVYPGIASSHALAYVGCAALGASFGLSYVLWIVQMRQLALLEHRWPVATCVATVAGFALGKLLGLALRLASIQEIWLPAGIVCMVLSLAALIAAGMLTRTLSGTPAEAQTRTPTGAMSGTPAHSSARTPSGAPTGSPAVASARKEAANPSVPLGRGEIVSTLLGCSLFALLFGLMTQLHNLEAQATVAADVISMLISAVLLAALGARLALSSAPLRVDRLILVTLPIIALVMIISPLFWSNVSDVSDALVKSFFNLYLAAVFVLLIEHAASDVLAPALFLGILWSFVAIGSACGFAFVNVGSDVAMTGAFLAGTWLCMLVAVLVAFINSKNAARAEVSARQAREEAAQAEREVVVVDRTAEQIRILGDQAGLSERERQVVSLLVQGRSAARIGKELYLSENTVKTHMQNIYAKLGIHTKQELLDRLAEVKIEAATHEATTAGTATLGSPMPRAASHDRSTQDSDAS